MSFKKFAMLILTVIMISGFCNKPVSASANDESDTVQAAQTTTPSVTEEVTQTEENTEVSKEASALGENTEEPKKDTAKTEVKKEAAKKTTAKKTTKKPSYTKSELRLMASIINCEAGAESYQGKLAVGIVVMNRVASKSFPNTVKKVIYQKYQFSPVRNGSLNKRLKQYDAGKTNSRQWKDCISAAKKALNGQKTIILKGKVKSMKGYHFFSVVLAGAKFKLGGHRFK